MPNLFPFEPDWRNGVTISREFKTSIISSRQFREQRIAERLYPRISVDFDLTLLKEQVGDFLSFMAANQQGVYDLPDWSRRAALVSGVAETASTLTLPFPPPWLEVGQGLMIRHEGVKRAYTVALLSGNTVTVVGTFGQAWPSGAKVYPLYRGVFSQSVRGSVITAKASRFQLGFRADPGSFAEPVDSPYPIVFNGRPLWLKRPNWQSAISESLRGYLETVDFDRGVVRHFSPVAWNSRTRQFSYLFRDPAEAEDFLTLFDYCKGQRGEFYAPTWLPDFDLSIGAATGATSLVVPGDSMRDRYGGSTVYGAVIALFRDGTYGTRRITGWQASGANSRVNFASAWNRPLNSTTVRLMCFLPVWRFASDESNLEWLTPQVAETKASLMTLEDLS